jgi:cysteine-rich repeat protein
MTGQWRQDATSGFGSSQDHVDFRQREGVVVSHRTSTGDLNEVGTIDTVTGEFSWSYPSGTFCGAAEVDGTVAADGQSYSAAGSTYYLVMFALCTELAFTETGIRCGEGMIDAGEGCDDGNRTDGDGCSSTCTVEPCYACSGEPSACTALPDATPCNDGDPCTLGDTCDDAQCVATAFACPLCRACDGNGGCNDSPRTACHTSLKPTATKLAVTDRTPDAKDAFGWRWKKGSTTASSEYGDPRTTTDVAMCLFDESGPTPALVFQAIVPAGGSCTTPPCWVKSGDGSYAYDDEAGLAAGITSIDLRTGADGRAKIDVKGRGAELEASSLGFPAAPLGLPLRAQVQIEGAGCFEAEYDAGGASKNANGVFKAKGTPAP